MLGYLGYSFRLHSGRNLNSENILKIKCIQKYLIQVSSTEIFVVVECLDILSRHMHVSNNLLTQGADINAFRLRDKTHAFQFLAYDTQMLMGGRKHQLSPEEYIYGALQLYLDVVYLFLIILSLFGGKNNWTKCIDYVGTCRLTIGCKLLIHCFYNHLRVSSSSFFLLFQDFLLFLLLFGQNVLLVLLFRALPIKFTFWGQFLDP